MYIAYAEPGKTLENFIPSKINESTGKNEYTVVGDEKWMGDSRITDWCTDMIMR